MADRRYYLTSDGWFKFYVNVTTGEKKFKLDPGDVEVPHRQDDFYRTPEGNTESTEE